MRTNAGASCLHRLGCPEGRVFSRVTGSFDLRLLQGLLLHVPLVYGTWEIILSVLPAQTGFSHPYRTVLQTSA